jgi:hypothetical protein
VTGVSRRRLLKLAVYSVPAMQMLNVAASSRALALTPLGHCDFPVRVRDVDSTRPGYKAVCCTSGTEHFQFQPTHCDKYVSTGVNGRGFVFVRCDTNEVWEPAADTCYTWTGCRVLGQEECYQGWVNC